MAEWSVDQSPGKSSSSDDEIFIGKMTLKEAKKHIFMDRRTFTCVEPLQEQLDSSLRIIETTSEPDLLAGSNSIQSKSPKSPNVSITSSSHNKSNLNSSWDGVSDESFLKVENMVSMLTASSDDNNVNNTPSIVNKIINMDIRENEYANELTRKDVDGFGKAMINKSELEATSSSSLASDAYYTPAKVDPACTPHQEVLTTPSCPKKELFKTPAKPISSKKVLSTKKTPSKTLAFQHIASPIALYIKGSQIPLIKNVKPKKPLPSCTSIPKLQKSQTAKASNKENFKLPSLAYKSAKKTQVIKLPDESVMPSSQWVKKIHSSLPRPVVLKHERREMDFSRKPLASQTEDSFADLTCNQADLSVCTQKSALVKPKKIQK